MDQLNHPALFWESEVSSTAGAVRCKLCPHQCLIEVGKRGLCRSRHNIDGKLYAINFGRAVSLSVDPIEKKPLYHYYPGSRILSTGPNSCNLSCFFCQNHSISQKDCTTRELKPRHLMQVIEDNPLLPRRLALTYTEPLTWYEYIMDLAESLPDIRLVLITNGYIETGPLEELLPRIDAMNVDLKSIRDDFYTKACGGRVEPVLNTIRTAVAQGIHVEVTNLIIPGMNDSVQDLEELARSLSEINPGIPLHFSAYYPSYKSSIPATRPQRVLQARTLALRYLSWVYAGNIGPGTHSETFCPVCGELLISRGINGVESHIPKVLPAKCPVCEQPIGGRFGD